MEKADRGGNRKWRIAGRVALLVLRVVWVATMVLTPLLAMWISSSLAAYLNRSLWACLAVGLVLFPILPIAWDQLALWRRRRKGDQKKRILTMLDRLVLRTLALNGAFIAIVLSLAPGSTYRALSTRGDWMLDGSDSAFANNVRGKLFAIADSFGGLYSDDSDEMYGESDDAPDFDSEPAKVANDRWPLPDAIHPTVVDMPESVATSPESVAKYLAERISDPFELTKALHDFVVVRLEYDYDALAALDAGRYDEHPSQQPADVFAARKAVCEGYSRLLAEMGKVAGIEIRYLVGKSRRRADDTDGVGHAWNAAKLEGQWYLIDATWNDDGTDDKGEPTLETTYLFTPPELFGLDHFPDDPAWQLREEPIDFGEFLRQPGIRPRFALLDLTLRQPRRSQVTVSGRFDAIIDNPRGAYITAVMRKDGKEVGRCDVKRGDTTRVTCQLPSDGRFSVDLYGNTEQYGSYPHIAELFVNSR